MWIRKSRPHLRTSAAQGRAPNTDVRTSVGVASLPTRRLPVRPVSRVLLTIPSGCSASRRPRRVESRGEAREVPGGRTVDYSLCVRSPMRLFTERMVVLGIGSLVVVGCASVKYIRVGGTTVLRVRSRSRLRIHNARQQCSNQTPRRVRRVVEGRRPSTRGLCPYTPILRILAGHFSHFDCNTIRRPPRGSPRS